MAILNTGIAHRLGVTSRAGFTAIEVSAVATIIAIMALILIPVVRTRVEESRRVAAMDDMKGIETAQQIAYGYTSYYFRLQDLSRPESNPNGANLLIEGLKLPPATWNAPVTSGQFANLVANWKGSFVSYHNTRSVADLILLFPFLFRSPTNDPVNNPNPPTGFGGGPILVQGTDQVDWINPSDDLGLERIQYPVDPWGNPYIFFGPGSVGSIGPPAIDVANQQDYSTAIVYSTGPDGGPANNAGGATFGSAINYFRESGLLGAVDTDDLKREF